MKFSNQGEDPWSWWQTLRLRMEIRKRMTPLTPDQANKRRFVVALLYCACAALTFHIFAFRAGALSHNPSERDVALEHMNEGKLVVLENFKIKKIQDYRSEDFDDKIKKTNKPSNIL